MNKTERFNQAFNYLRSKGKVKTQQDIADVMGASRPNVSMALKGEPRVLTDRFLIRFCNSFQGIFNVNWMLTGEGQMLEDDEERIDDEKRVIDESNTVNVLLAEKDKRIEQLEQFINSLRREIELRESHEKTLQRMIDMLEQDIDRLSIIQQRYAPPPDDDDVKRAAER